MTTLHMDVESVRSAQSNMNTQHQQLVSLLQNITNSVNSTVGSAWLGNSATEFQQQYEQLRSALTAQLDQLQTLSTSLSSEITQWEEMASHLG